MATCTFYWKKSFSSSDYRLFINTEVEECLEWNALLAQCTSVSGWSISFVLDLDWEQWTYFCTSQKPCANLHLMWLHERVTLFNTEEYVGVLNDVFRTCIDYTGQQQKNTISWDLLNICWNYKKLYKRQYIGTFTIFAFKKVVAIGSFSCLSPHSVGDCGLSPSKVEWEARGSVFGGLICV